jgi:hypothetical protein
VTITGELWSNTYLTLPYSTADRLQSQEQLRMIFQSAGELMLQDSSTTVLFTNHTMLEAVVASPI